jgi:hypothetical protein
MIGEPTAPEPVVLGPHGRTAGPARPLAAGPLQRATRSGSSSAPGSGRAQPPSMRSTTSSVRSGTARAPVVRAKWTSSGTRCFFDVRAVGATVRSRLSRNGRLFWRPTPSLSTSPETLWACGYESRGAAARKNSTALPRGGPWKMMSRPNSLDAVACSCGAKSWSEENTQRGVTSVFHGGAQPVDVRWVKAETDEVDVASG